MAKGYYLVLGDKTTCGGKILGGEPTHTIMGKPVAREQEPVTCGQHPGIYKIIGHIPGDSIMGRKFAGSLHSKSSCPCQARFVPSMVNDAYDFSPTNTGVSKSTTDNSNKVLDNRNHKNEEKPKIVCQHNDGAISVANYILDEIKRNVRCETANQIRYFIDEETLNQRRQVWDELPFYVKLTPPPQQELLLAMALWYPKVKTGAIWDHKQIIRQKFLNNAVTRPLESGQLSKSYYHKYKRHDYYLDVWSNIHYGFVGLSVGFSESLLLNGSSWEQNMTPGAMGNDTIDDVTSMRIGFALFKEHGKFAESLTTQNILDALEFASDSQLAESRSTHWCWNSENPEYIPFP
ncbi:polymorphic toxin type 44 domain-containing protein [Rahnella variigena]|uniref:Bacterial toxin 44 domain-containing protein n=2 Tax=Rahnella variigena TaxID=574964 RepID=A0ABX9PPX5_9GAMM|nr:polymorphic toxin type 44 domain-containing protein [Rahnella variigena]RKF66467.1 hypothetical protein CKQ54_24095 [Rahnella variigena]